MIGYVGVVGRYGVMGCRDEVGIGCRDGMGMELWMGRVGMGIWMVDMWWWNGVGVWMGMWWWDGVGIWMGMWWWNGVGIWMGMW